MQKEGQTIQYLNVIKFISIFLVVFCHIVLLKNDGYIDNFTMLLCWAGVPCFFLVNGALMFRKELNIKKHYKKVLNIYIVNVIWRIIYLIIAITILKVNIDNVAKSEILKYTLFFGQLKGVNTGHLYFIEALIGCYLVFPVLYQCYKTKEGKKCLIILCIVIFLLVYGVNAINFGLKLVIGSDKLSIAGIRNILLFGGNAHYLLFFILGAFLNEEKDRIQAIKGIKWICASIIIISLVGLALIKYSTNQTFKWQGILLTNGYSRLSTFTMSIAVFIFFQGINIKNKYLDKVINEIGYNTLSIYYMHVPILTILCKYVYRYITFRGVTINLLKTVIVIFIIYIITFVLKKIPLIKRIV